MRISMRLILGAIYCLTNGVQAAPAMADRDITGQVRLPGGAPAWNAAIYFDGAQRSVPLAHAVMDQRDKTFIPHVSIVTRGTTVRFPNDDTVFHNVFAYFEAKKFDLGMYPRGATKSVTFEKVGLVSLLCNVHSDMSAYILIVDTPYYAVTDRQGRFRIHDVPPGVYTLHAWHESGATFTQTTTLASGGKTLSVTLARK